MGMHPAGLAARLGGLAALILTVVFVAHSSVHDTTPDNFPYGGLKACFYCDNGWNWHVLLFTIAYPVFMAESMLAFKAPLFAASHVSRKWIHLLLQTGCVGLSVAGLLAIVQAKQATSSVMMYSVHSWTGAIAALLFAMQYIVGLAAFMLFKPALLHMPTLRASILYWHGFLGKLTFFAGMGTVVNGWADMQMMMVDSGQPPYGGATMLASAAAVASWLVSAAVCYVMFESRKEQAAPSTDSDTDDQVQVVPHGEIAKAC